MVEVARAESERGELVLRQRTEPDGSTTLELRANGVFVMDTRETSSERALAREALARHEAPGSVLVGGLGLGFTLAEVLADPRVRRVVVAEIEPALVGWLRDGTVPHGPALLADPRVEVRVADVADVIGEAEGVFDLVLLDVDNGPGYLVHDANSALYGRTLLGTTRRAMRPMASASSGPPPTTRPCTTRWPRCSATPRRRRTTSTCRAGPSSTGFTSRGYLRRRERLPSRVPHRARLHGRGPGPA